MHVTPQSCGRICASFGASCFFLKGCTVTAGRTVFGGATADGLGTAEALGSVCAGASGEGDVFVALVALAGNSGVDATVAESFVNGVDRTALGTGVGRAAMASCAVVGSTFPADFGISTDATPNHWNTNKPTMPTITVATKPLSKNDRECAGCLVGA